MMKRATSLISLSVFIAACGGGGESPPANNPLPLPVDPPAQRLSSYIGSWSSECSGHELDTATIVRTPGTTDSVNITVKTDYFTTANCTGNILGTFTDSGVYSAKYVAAVNTAVQFESGAAATPATIDQITASSTRSTQNVSGPGVVRTVKNGQPQWCIDFGGGNSTCILDMGAQPEQAGVSGGLLIQGSFLFVLSPSGNVYTVDEKLKKN